MSNSMDPSFDGGVWPQVGAVLKFLDPSGPRRADMQGSSRWDADGSAVLIAPRHALTIRHVASEQFKQRGSIEMLRLAVFFPSVGLVRVVGVRHMPGDKLRDRLLLLSLAKEIPLPPIPVSELNVQNVSEPQAVGFGAWEGPKPGRGMEHPERFCRGVQRRLAFTPASGFLFDVGWNIDQEIGAGINNSGGPVIERKQEGHQVVAVIRRQRDDILTATFQPQNVVAATAINSDRLTWLRKMVHRNFGSVDRPAVPPPVLWQELHSLGGPPLVGPFRLPPGTVKVHATLSAGREWLGDLLLQMKLLPDKASILAQERIWEDLARDFSSVGEFIVSSLDVRGESSVWVAITSASPLPGPIRAQLCLRFLDARGNMLAPVTSEPEPTLATSLAATGRSPRRRPPVVRRRTT